MLQCVAVNYGKGLKALLLANQEKFLAILAVRREVHINTNSLLLLMRNIYKYIDFLEITTCNHYFHAIVDTANIWERSFLKPPSKIS